MNEALKIYINIYSIFNILSFAFNKIKVIDMKSKVDNLKTKTMNLNSELTIYDFIALFSTLYCLIKLISYGTSFFWFINITKKRCFK